jgi:hypothetical protein
VIRLRGGIPRPGYPETSRTLGNHLLKHRLEPQYLPECSASLVEDARASQELLTEGGR